MSYIGIMSDKIGRKNLYALVLGMITLGTLASSLAGPTQAISVLGLLGFWYLFVNLGEYFLVLVSAVIIHYQVL